MAALREFRREDSRQRAESVGGSAEGMIDSPTTLESQGGYNHMPRGCFACTMGSHRSCTGYVGDQDSRRGMVQEAAEAGSHWI